MITVTYDLASRRFSKTWFDTKNDWAAHPPSIYTCPHCSATTALTRGDLESALDRQGGQAELALLAQLSEACSWVWRDQFDTVCPFNCSGYGRDILLGFETSTFRGTGRRYRLAIVGEDLEAQANA
jgi:hypothetical protein